VRNPNDIYDFSAFGQAIKKARENRGLTREKVAEIVDLAPRYILSIENTGQHPSLQKLYELVRLFDISVDEYFFPDKSRSKTTQRRQLESILDGLDDNDLNVVTATAKAIQKNKKSEQ